MDKWIQLFGSTNPAVRDRAAAAILRQGADAPLPVLLEILDDLHDHGLGADAERVLVERRDADLLPAMIARLRSPSAFVREVACTVLGALKDRSATPLLLAALGDESVMVRKRAAHALGTLADPASGPAILRHYRARRDDINVRMAMEWAMDELGVPYRRRSL